MDDAKKSERNLGATGEFTPPIDQDAPLQAGSGRRLTDDANAREFSGSQMPVDAEPRAKEWEHGYHPNAPNEGIERRST